MAEHERKRSLANTISRWVAHGYRVESQSDFFAVVVTKHRPTRWPARTVASSENRRGADDRRRAGGQSTTSGSRRHLPEQANRVIAPHPPAERRTRWLSM